MLKADWIQSPITDGKISPLFLREFEIKKQIASATLKISARGVYEATLNGKRVGNFIMAPGWTEYKKRIQVQEYDVADMLLENNRLIIQLASGWFGDGLICSGTLKNTQPLAIIAELKIVYTDGGTEFISTDGNWLTAESRLKYCDIYNGIKYDATYEPQFTVNAVVSECNDKSVLIKQIGEEIIEHERIKPIKVIKTPAGETVIDFGQNMAGYLEITVNAKAGERISFSFAEILDKNGNFYNENYRDAKALYEYICRDGLQTYKPNLTFYGFRYVRVDEYPVEINPDNFTAIVIHSNMKRTGKIETSDPMLNQLFHNVIWGQKSNYIDVPTDCPQRDERLGWTGDAQVFVRTGSYNFDVRKFFGKWLGDMKLDQTDTGAIPKVIPSTLDGPPYGAAWGDAVTICPWQIYLTYGDKEVLKQMFEPMKKWVDYITSVTEKPNLWFGGEHYGDWLELKCKYGERKGETRDCLVASAFYAYSTQLLCKTGRVIGEDVTEYEKLYKNIVAAFKEEFKDNFKTQTEHILPLYFELTDHPHKIAESLVNMIHNDGDMLQTGFVGTPYLLHVLSKYGYNELAYTLLLRKEYPSWLYPITKGATTMWEHWDGIKPNGDIWPAGMNSYNHYAYGAVADWMYGVCAGINTVEKAPGFEKVYFAPVTDDRIDWFYAEIETVHGKVSSKWEHKDGRVVYEITTPVNATALIDGKEYKLEAGTHRF